MKFINIDDDKKEVQTNQVVSDDSNNESKVTDSELDFNKANREDYEKLMKDSSTNKDGYWDSNNPFVKLFLLGLGVVIVLGALYYILTYMAQK